MSNIRAAKEIGLYRSTPSRRNEMANFTLSRLNPMTTGAWHDLRYVVNVGVRSIEPVLLAIRSKPNLDRPGGVRA